MLEEDKKTVEDQEDDFEVIIDEDDDDTAGSKAEAEERDAKNQIAEEPDEKADADEEGIDDLGKRAQKRIRKLVADRKALEAQARTEAERAAKLEEELKKTKATAQKASVDQSEHTLNSQLEALESRWTKAVESDDTKELFKLNSELSRVNSRLDRLQEWKQYEEAGGTEVEVDAEPTKQQQQLPQIPEPDEKAKAWHKENGWFHKDRAMTLYALDTHARLYNEGYNPNDFDDPDFGADAYYGELNKAVREEFPERFKEGGDSPPKAKQKVAGARRSSPGKDVVHLTKSEKEMAQRLNIDPKVYAKQKLLRDKRAEK